MAKLGPWRFEPSEVHDHHHPTVLHPLVAMPARSIEQRALAAARAVATDRGVPCGQAVVVNSASNVVVHLQPSPVVARVMSGTVALHADPELWLSREVSILGFLAPSGLAVAPSPLIAPGPHERDDLWMTFWGWVERRGPTEPNNAERFGRALRDLHDALSGFMGDLAGPIEVQHDIERLLRQLRPASGLSAQRIAALHERLLDISDSAFGAPLPAQTLHGDVSLSNLLCTSEGLVWNDFEDTFRGPVHWDVASFVMSLEAAGAGPAYVERLLGAYGWADRMSLAPFTKAHELYGEIWRLYDAQRSA